MEFSKFDVRSAADRGALLHLKDPFTGEPLYDDDGQKVGFMVRGMASREAAEDITKARKAASAGASNAHDMHENEVRVAMACVVEAVNIDWNGEAVGKNMNMIRKVLDTTFPEIRQKDDDELKPGEVAEVDYLNTPFALQIVRFAARQDHFLAV